MRDDNLPLFSWQPPTCTLIPFPMVKRVGRIRDVAVKLLDKPTARAAEHYRDQVAQAVSRQMEKIGLSESETEQQLMAFWEAVRVEMVRLTYAGHGTGGAA